MQKRPQAKKPIFWALEYEYSGNQAPKFEECQKNGTVILKILCRLEYTLLQTSSWESKIMKNPFGWKFKNTVKMQSESKWVSNFYN